MNDSAAELGSTRIDLTHESGHWVGRFTAMASPCEVLIEAATAALARQIVETAAGCAYRIERKFSRYRSDNIVHEINSSAGRAVVLDEQTAGLVDFGGIGKEYAVDMAATLVEAIAPGLSCLINFGGDVVARNPRRDGQPWRVGIEAADQIATAATIVHLHNGALATSGDSRRFVLHEGRRLPHILDARTGRPVENAARSITVAADTCTQAGTLTTLAMLQGPDAARFLQASGMRHWIQ